MQNTKIKFTAIFALAAASCGAAVWNQNEFAVKCFKACMPDDSASAVCPPFGISKIAAALGTAMPPERRNNIAKTIGLYSDFTMSFGEVRRNAVKPRSRVDNDIRGMFAIWTPLPISMADPVYVRDIQDNYGGEVLNSMYREHANHWIDMATDGVQWSFLGRNAELSRNDCSLTAAFSATPRFLEPFDPAESYTNDFKTSRGAKIKRRYISGVRTLRTAETPSFKAVALPLRGGLSLWLVKPVTNATAPAVMQSFSFRSFESISSALRENPSPLRSQTFESEDFTAAVADGETLTMRGEGKFRISFPAFSIRTKLILPPLFRKWGFPLKGFDKISVNAGFGLMVCKTVFTLGEGGEPEFGDIVVEGEKKTVRKKAAPKDASAKMTDEELIAARRAALEKAKETPPPEMKFDSQFLFFVWQDDPGIVLFAGRYTGNTR